jgi:hypothetical protein
VRKPGLDGESWPSGVEELALRAALLAGPAAAVAWDALATALGDDPAGVAVAREHPEVLRLLPLVAHNVTRLAPDDERLAPLTALAKRNWYRTTTIVRSAVPALECLAGAGIRTMVLKGTPLALAYYANPGLRFLSDVDLMVPYADAERALDRLVAAGWRRGTVVPRRRLWRVGHSENLAHPEHGNLDLHWRLSMPLVVESDRDRSEDDVWDAAVPLEVAGHPTLIPGAADLLLHACIHGAWRESGATARWVADACTIVHRATERLDWDRLVAQVARRRVAIRMRNDLAYVATEFGAAVPDAALSALRALPVTPRERRTYLALTREPPANEYAHRLAIVNGYWLEKMGAAPRWRQAYELPGYLQDTLRLEHGWEIPLELTARLRRELGRRRSGSGDG